VLVDGNSLVLAITISRGMVTFLAALRNSEHCHTHLPSPLPYTTYRGYFGIRSCFYVYRQPQESLWFSFLSGLAEPVGAVIGYLVLAPFLDDNVFGIIFGMIAGIMVFISLDELLPAAEEYGKHHHAIYGLVVGMAVMALSLLMLG